jgi:hypothetical protein
VDSVVIGDFDSWTSTSSKRISDPLEAAVAEVLYVDGGEFGDALLDEERGPPIVGAAAGEVGLAEFRPESVMEIPVVRRESGDLPAGVMAECLADIGGGGGREGLGEHGFSDVGLPTRLEGGSQRRGEGHGRFLRDDGGLAPSFAECAG